MPPSPLSEGLHEPVTSEARLEIVRQLWPSLLASAQLRKEIDWNSYFSFYSRECNAALVEEGKHLCARSHNDLLQITRLLRTESTRQEVKLKIRQRFTQHRPIADEEAMLIGSIKLATRILAMTNTGPLANEVSGQRSISWSDEPLHKAVNTHFEEDLDSDFENYILGSELTARNVDRIAKISIIWTDNLVDHLRLVERDKKLCVFHHASFLRHMEHVQSPMYPEKFVRETLDTLTLLFPGKDRKTKQWLDGELMESPLAKMDLGLLHMGSWNANHASRRLDNYHFWRNRLGALKDAVKEATPFSEDVIRTLRDRKQGDRWFNSWVAVVAIGLTLFFGLVQSVEGAVQVWKAYHPTAD